MRWHLNDVKTENLSRRYGYQRMTRFLRYLKYSCQHNGRSQSGSTAIHALASGIKPQEQSPKSDDCNRMIMHTSRCVPSRSCDVPLFCALAGLKAEASHTREVFLPRLLLIILTLTPTSVACSHEISVFKVDSGRCPDSSQDGLTDAQGRVSGWHSARYCQVPPG